MAKTPLNKIEIAHQMYREGRYDDALGFYTEALSMVKTKAQEIALHSNRAACYLKLQDFRKAAEECTSVLELDQKHTGALMLRAQTLVTLKEYHSALFDVNRLMELNPSSEVYQNLYTRLKTQLSLATIAESEAEIEEEEEEQEEQEAESSKYEEQGVNTIGVTSSGEGEKVEVNVASNPREVIIPRILKSDQQVNGPSNGQAKQESWKETELKSNSPAKVTAKAENAKKPSDQHSNGWQAIPKPKGHSALDYARWDSVANDSSEDDDDDSDEETLPQYRFRVRTVGVRPVK